MVATMDIDIALDELLLARPVTRDDIVQAYRRMAIRFHPDKAEALDEKAWVQRKFVRVHEAYRLLSESPIEEINGCSGYVTVAESNGAPATSTEEPSASGTKPIERDELIVLTIVLGFLSVLALALMCTFLHLLPG